MEHYFTNNPYLKSEFRNITYKYDNTEFSFCSDLGVFSKDCIDTGSKTLVETFLKYHDKEINKVLDVGCGYGFVGIVISKIKKTHVDLIDVNKRCIHLTEMNIESNKVDGNVYYSDAYSFVADKYDVIITNPPIRVGKQKVLDILINAKDHLNSNGTLWFVARKDQGVKSLIKSIEKYYKIDILEKNKGFYVIKAEIY